jgi:nucleotide-binding universal stress UspA family protein
MYKDVLLPIDLNHESSWRKALPVAVAVCKQFQANLHLLTVIPDFGVSMVSQYFPESHQQQMKKNALDGLHALSSEHVGNDVSVQHIVGEGTVYQLILETAQDMNADLIVLAAHRPELKDYLLGPNASRVVRHAKCSVYVIRE